MSGRELTAAESNALHHSVVKCKRSVGDLLKAIGDLDGDHDLDVIVTCVLLLTEMTKLKESRKDVPAYPSYRDNLRTALTEECFLRVNKALEALPKDHFLKGPLADVALIVLGGARCAR